MKVRREPVGDTRICNAGCNPNPQPIGNFYKYPDPSKEGFDLYRAVCKSCIKAKERTRHAALPIEKRRNRGRPTTGTPKLLATVDLVPCTDCGLRGHVAGDEDKCMWAGGASLGLGQQGHEWSL